MLISSRIKEANLTVCDVQLDDDHSAQSPLSQEVSTFDMGSYGQAQRSIICTAGLCILEVSFQFKKKVTDLFVIEGDHILMSFFFNGESRVMGADIDTLKLDGGLMRVNFQPLTRMEIEMQPDGQVRYIAVVMSRAYFLTLIQHETWTQSDPFIDDVLASRHFHLNKGVSLINHSILDILYQIFDNGHPGAHDQFRKTFIEMKLKEILFLFQLQHRDATPPRHNIDPETLSALEKARALLTTNFTKPPTIRQLSRDVSLNEQKLKQGFRLLYNTTIYAYVFQLRMEEAGRMILNPIHSVNQISAHLGYKSTSHFITAFKKYFGHTPRQAALQKTRLNKV